MESDRLNAEMNEQEWESVIEASSFCWPAWASLCQPLPEAQISIRSASLCAWQRVYRGSFLNQASPSAGTAPDKGPLWRGFLSPQTSAGKRLRRTNEHFCGREEQGTAVKGTDREKGNKQGSGEKKLGKDALTHAHTIPGSETQARQGVLWGPIWHWFNASYRHLCHISQCIPFPPQGQRDSRWESCSYTFGNWL